MHQLRLVAALSAVVASALIHFGIASAQTKITIGYAAVSPRTTPLYLAQEHMMQLIWRLC
jgi:hypothetical protein